MSEFEQMILSELSEIKDALAALRSDFTLSQITYFENLAPDAPVGTDYVAFRFGCKEAAVIRGRFETDKIPRFRNKPLTFIKRDVDALWKELNRSVSEKAARIRDKAKSRKLL